MSLGVEGGGEVCRVRRIGPKPMLDWMRNRTVPAVLWGLVVRLWMVFGPTIAAIKADRRSVKRGHSSTRCSEDRGWPHGQVSGSCPGKASKAVRLHRRRQSARVFRYGVDRRCLGMPKVLVELVGSALWLSAVIIVRH